jgi:hypothetical protein
LVLILFEEEKIIYKASCKYQKLKINELDEQKEAVSFGKYQKQFKGITEKSCFCLGSGTSAMMLNEIERKVEVDVVSICPGPNLAYYSQIKSLGEMVDPIWKE